MASALLQRTFGGVAFCIALSAVYANAQDALTIRKIDPGMRIEDLNKSNKTCYIIIRDGKAYEICNLRSPEIEDILKAIEAG